MLVNPGLLRAFAAHVDAASGAVRAADIGQKADAGADGLPGSTTQWALRLVATHMNEQANKIAKNIGDMGTDVRGAGDKYEVEDGDLAGKFGGLFS
jgi:hypothetical protein